MDKAIVKKYDDIKVPAYIQARIGQYDQMSIPPSDFETDGCSGGMSTLWRKVFPEELEKADQHLTDTIFELLKRKR